MKCETSHVAGNLEDITYTVLMMMSAMMIKIYDRRWKTK